MTRLRILRFIFQSTAICVLKAWILYFLNDILVNVLGQVHNPESALPVAASEDSNTFRVALDSSCAT